MCAAAFCPLCCNNSQDYSMYFLACSTVLKNNTSSKSPDSLRVPECGTKKQQAKHPSDFWVKEIRYCSVYTFLISPKK